MSNAVKFARPYPPASLIDAADPAFTPAPELAAWLADVFLCPAGPLFDPAHEILSQSLIGCLWTNVANVKGGAPVAGQAERPKFDGPVWIKARAEFQLVQWFGDVPDFVLTFDARLAAEATDRRWCALADHELRHCVQGRDRFGAPRFDRDGRPVFTLATHDVEEFVAVAARYGVDSCCGRSADFVAAAARPALLDDRAIARACGRPA